MTEKKETYEPQFLVTIQTTLDTFSFTNPPAGDDTTINFTNPHRITIQCGEHSFNLRLRPGGLLIRTLGGWLEIQPQAGDSVLLREV